MGWSLRLFFKALGAALGVALLFVLFHPLDLSTPQELAPRATPAFAGTTPTATPYSLRVGLVAGHTGGDDPGAICPDGITEAQVNARIARHAARILESIGVKVDVLQEFDPRLQGYQALALVSVHADSCQVSPEHSGFKLAISDALQREGTPQQRARARRLKECLQTWYQDMTKLDYDPYTITRDMREYHAFKEVDPDTPAVIIEVGFLAGDYELLVNRPEVPARGIALGILCFARTENILLPYPEENLPPLPTP